MSTYGTMGAYLAMLTGTDDPDILLEAARWAITTGMTGSEAQGIIAMACDEFGPETVYMDGEIFA